MTRTFPARSAFGFADTLLETAPRQLRGPRLVKRPHRRPEPKRVSLSSSARNVLTGVLVIGLLAIVRWVAQSGLFTG